MSDESVKVLMNGTDIVGISTYAKLLQNTGYEVHTAFNGADMLDVLSKNNFNFHLIVIYQSIGTITGNNYVTSTTRDIIRWS